MTETIKTFTAYQKAKAAYDCWIFSFRIWAGIENNDITSRIYNIPININVREEKKTLVLPADNQNVNLKLLAHNLEHIAQGACFLVFDEALKDILKRKTKIMVKDFESLRAIIYMFRCAFAHNPLRPKWRIETCYRKKYYIKEINFNIDFSQLHGKELTLEQSGGLESTLRLIKFCLMTINNIGR
jgi:hypothetical protein